MAIKPMPFQYSDSVALSASGPAHSGALVVADQRHYLAPVQPPIHAPPPPQPPPSPPTSTPAAESIISIADLIGYLRKRWKNGLLMAIPLAVLTFVALGLGQKIYEAEAQLLLRIQDANVFNFDELGRSSVGELSAPLLINNHRTEMTSRSFEEYFHDYIPVARRIAYIEPDLNHQSVTDILKDKLGLSKPKKAPDLREVFIKKIAAATRVEPLKESHILRVQVRGNNPIESAAMANDYVQAYIEYVANQELSGTRSASEFLSKKSEELRNRLRASEAQLAAYRQEASVMKSGPGITSISDDKLRLLTAATADTEVKLTKARYELETIQQAQSSQDALLQVRTIADNPQVTAKRAELSNLQAQLTPLLEFCGPRHPKVVGLNNEIRARSSELSNLINAVVTMVSNEVETLSSQLLDFKSQVKDTRGDVIAMGDKEIQEKMLMDQVEIDRQMYQTIVMRMNQADVTGQFTDNGVLRIADIATPPETAIKPKKAIAAIAAMMMFGLVFIGLPIGWGLVDDHLLTLLNPAPPPPAPTPHTSVHTSPPPTPFTAAPTHAHLPTPAAPLTLNAGGRPTMLAEFPHTSGTAPHEVLAEILKSEPRGAANALRQLSAVLEKQSLHRSGPGGIILITSAEAGEGKSLTAAALAATFCHHGRRALVIDCHTSAPGLHRCFPQSERHSYSASQLSELQYGASGLYVLPAHDLPAHETNELLDGYRAWIDRARQDVDWIILDGPPVLKNFTDVAPLAPLATDVVVVHDRSHASPAKLRAAMTLLQPMMSSTAMRGLVANRVSG